MQFGQSLPKKNKTLTFPSKSERLILFPLSDVKLKFGASLFSVASGSVSVQELIEINRQRRVMLLTSSFFRCFILNFFKVVCF